MTKYEFHILRKKDLKEYSRLRWACYKSQINRHDYWHERWIKERNQGISGTNAGQARKHRGFHCEVCGSKEQLVAHHRNQNQNDSRPENILTVCFPCHNRIHSNLKQKEVTVN